MATGDDDDIRQRGRPTTTMTTRMAMAQWATKLAMMATMTTVATDDDKDDGNGATGDVATGYEDDDDGDGWRRQ